MKRTLLAWHWLNADSRIATYTDAPHAGTLVTPGLELVVKPPVELCRRGLHASERAIDALEYAPGPICCRVELSGRIVRGADKCAATRRTVIAMVDATQVLGEWSCDVAEVALTRERDAGREPDPRSWAALEVKRRWLRGEASDIELDAAWAAARDAFNELLEPRLLVAMGLEVLR